MTIQERIEADYKAAFKNHDEVTVTTLRLIKSAFTNAEIALRRQLDDAGTIPVLTQLRKRHLDSIGQFQKGGRTDLADHERAQLAVVERYLPSQASDDDIRAAVRKVVAELPAKDVKFIGQAMGKVMPTFAGTADGNRVRAIVSEELAKP